MAFPAPQSQSTTIMAVDPIDPAVPAANKVVEWGKATERGCVGCGWIEDVWRAKLYMMSRKTLL